MKFAVVGGGGGGGGLCLPFKTLNTDLKHSKDIPPMQLAEAVQSEGYETFQTSVRDFKSTRDL